MHCYDAMFEKIHIPMAVLCFICKDGHLIKSERMKKIATQANAGGCDNLLKYMTDVTWFKKHHKFSLCDRIEDLFYIYHKHENHMVALPEDTLNIELVLRLYCQKTGYYPDFLHFNSKGL